MVTASEERSEQGLRRGDRRGINRGDGYGLEIPWIYRLYGHRVYVYKRKELVDSFRAKGLS